MIKEQNADSGNCKGVWFLPDKPERILIYVHGGGWCLGSAYDVKDFCSELAEKASCAIFSVEYRLAPEFPAPAANQDVEAAIKYATKFAEELGVANNKIFLAGDSSGGHLALCAARENAELVNGLFLIYPVTTLLPDETSKSWLAYKKDWQLSPALMKNFINKYAPDELLKSLSPLELDCSMLPFVFIISAENDILLDQQTDFAYKVKALQIVYEGAYHIFLARPNGIIFKERAIRDIANKMIAKS